MSAKLPVVHPGTRAAGLRRAVRLERFTLVYNLGEAAVGMIAGLAAGSVALVGFALDSIVESSSAGVVLWRLHAETSGKRATEDAERRAVRGVAVAFLALAAYVGLRSGIDLVGRSRPDESTAGILLALVSLVVMPVLALRKRSAATEIDSRSLRADSTQTALCTYLSAFLLVGLAANAVLGWWWADPVAGLAIAGFALKEGVELWRTDDLCCP